MSAGCVMSAECVPSLQYVCHVCKVYAMSVECMPNMQCVPCLESVYHFCRVCATTAGCVPSLQSAMSAECNVCRVCATSVIVYDGTRVCDVCVLCMPFLQGYAVYVRRVSAA